MKSSSPASPLRVVCYRATLEAPSAILARICRIAGASQQEMDALARSVFLTWPGAIGRRSLHVFVVATRGNSAHAALENIRHDNDAIEAEFDALAHADAIIFLASAARALIGKTLHFAKMLQADLVATGQSPSTVPVVFQIEHGSPHGMPEIDFAELRRLLVWPRCDYVDAMSDQTSGAKASLDRVIELYEEMQAERRQPGAPDAE